MRIVAIVLAAGEGRRMGGPKALLRMDGDSFLRRCCRLFAEAGLDAVVAVLGAQAAQVKVQAGIPEHVATVVNEGWPEGMLSSVRRGLDRAQSLTAQAVLLHPVDHPLVSVATISRVRDALAAGALLVAPTWQGRRGHPGGFARAVFHELHEAPPGQGARAVLAARPERVVHVEGDPGCLAGVDRPEDLERLRALAERARGALGTAPRDG